MKHSIELSPLQLTAFQTTRLNTQRVNDEVADMKERATKLGADAEALGRAAARVEATTLEQIGTEHNVAIPGDAQILNRDGVTIFEWTAKAKAKTKVTDDAKRAAAKARRQARATKKAATKNGDAPKG